MSIEKKSLISTLKTTKKANVASSDLDAKPTKVESKKGTVLTRKHFPTRKSQGMHRMAPTV
jgi:hypothetical protein